MTTEQTIAKARKNLAAARTMNRNARLKRYEGRNGGGSYAETYEATAYGDLAAISPKLAAVVFTEHDLCERVSESKDAGMGNRPELRARIAECRRAIRSFA